MIKSFAHKGLQRFFEADDPKKVPPQYREKIRAILTALDSAEAIEEMNLVTFRLHKLSGDRQGVWAVTVRANWRITFRFIDGDAYAVTLEDYH